MPSLTNLPHRELGIRALGVFGSAARGEMAAESDIDIYVEFEPEARTFANYNRLCELLEERLDRPFDLVTKDGLSPHLRDTIMAEMVYVPLAS